MTNGWLPNLQGTAPLHFGVYWIVSRHNCPYRSVG